MLPSPLRRFIARFAPPPARVAEQGERAFHDGSRPVIRWIKGDGLDDPVTRAAIGQATRLFGDGVDYCLCTSGLSASRVRRVLSWATQPVEWQPLGPRDNPELADILARAGCGPDRYGYWWKWLPERARPNGPEWILDGDMVVTGAPVWFDAWRRGVDVLRVAQDDRWPPEGMYGDYVARVDLSLKLYSGLVSLPPGLRYMPAVAEVLAGQPLHPGHDGCLNMSEQGVIAAAFGRLGATPIPLGEFPFGRAFEDHLDYGLRGGPADNVWGYHFGHAFRGPNKHFERLRDEGRIFDGADLPPPPERFAWLRNFGQWGRPGWSMHPDCAARIGEIAAKYAGRATLELGTSRGHLTAQLASRGCRVTTMDHVDRGASRNLADMGVEFIVGDAVARLSRESRQFDLITVDLHGNDEPTWRRLWPVLAPRLAPGGSMVLYNSHLWRIDEFREETGIRWVMNSQLARFRVIVHELPPPGMIVCEYV